MIVKGDGIFFWNVIQLEHPCPTNIGRHMSVYVWVGIFFCNQDRISYNCFILGPMGYRKMG